MEVEIEHGFEPSSGRRQSKSFIQVRLSGPQTSFRHSDPDHAMNIEPILKKAVDIHRRVRQEDDGVIVDLPTNLAPTHKSTIWDTTKLSYEVDFQLTMMKIKDPLHLSFPITIVQQHPKVGERSNGVVLRRKWDLLLGERCQKVKKLILTRLPKANNIVSTSRSQA